MDKQYTVIYKIDTKEFIKYYYNNINNQFIYGKN
jgi:hypothetical protein